MNQVICNQCVMDRSAPEIVFDKFGVCNFCRIAQQELEVARIESFNLEKVVERMKKAGREGKYDCLIGLSGGVDSSLTLHYAVALGLRPLCFSLDNGWNTKESDENIMRLVETLKVPFYRYTIDIPKFLELQGAFMKAGLINVEATTDHLLMAATYDMATKYGIKYIVSGGNVATESIMPASWSYSARDLTHIRDVYRKMMGKQLSGLPLCGLLRWNWYRWIRRIRVVYLLDYYGYNREEAKKILAHKYGWQDYGEKHCENTFTWWFQNFYLFSKFGIDKRKAHLSSLINSGQMTRNEALLELEKNPVYPKLGMENRIMRYPRRSHYDFKTDKWYGRIAQVVRFFYGNY